MKRKPYGYDLTDAQWAVLEPLIPPAKPGGAPRRVAMREVVNAILYVLHTGCAWAALPHDFPAWQPVYWYFRKFVDDEDWQHINGALRTLVREQDGRDAQPTAAIIDSQSVKTTERGGRRATTLARR
jgi:putative transposase